MKILNSEAIFRLKDDVTPIIILAHERPRQLRDMILSIERNTQNYAIIICDNGSRQQNMKAYLRRLSKKYIVILNQSNLLLNGINRALGIINAIGYKYFVFSDPDIILNKNTPKNWIEIFKQLAEKYNLCRVGTALDISELPHKKINRSDYIKQCESGYWTKVFQQDIIPDKCYDAPIDTTLALYRSDSFDSIKNNCLPLRHNGTLDQWEQNKKYKGTIRVAGRFTAQHTGWLAPVKYKNEYKKYVKSIIAGRTSSIFPSTTMVYEGLYD